MKYLRLLFPRLRFLALWIAGMLVMQACGTGMEEVVEETFPDGSPKLVRYYEEGKKGKELVKETDFYPNKQQRMSGEYKQGERDGYWVYYYENGNKWSEGYFSKGLSEGKRTTYFENGKKRYEGQYKSGKRVGTWKFYSENGKPAREVDYSNENALHPDSIGE